jgi:hypothetical protein
MPFSTTAITNTIILAIANQKLWRVTNGRVVELVRDSRRDVVAFRNLGLLFVYAAIYLSVVLAVDDNL